MFPNMPHHTINSNDINYPKRFSLLDNPPDALYTIGNTDLLRDIDLYELPSIAIVGSRKSSPYGKDCAQKFATIAAEHGMCLISGGSLGVSTTAIKTALAHEIPIIVVLAQGLDAEAYPKENEYLFEKIVNRGGILLSEQNWQQPPRPIYFRMRNRLITALSDTVLACEIGLPSGTFSFCDKAYETGVKILAVPGNITSPQSQGTNTLIVNHIAQAVIDEQTFMQHAF